MSFSIFLISMTPRSPPGLTDLILLLVLVCSDDHPQLPRLSCHPPLPAAEAHRGKAAARTHGNNIRYAEARMTCCPPKTSLETSYQGSLRGGWMIVISIPRLEPRQSYQAPILDTDCF